MVDQALPPPAVKADARDFRVWGAASTGPKDPSVTKFEALDTDLDVLIEEDRCEVSRACRARNSGLPNVPSSWMAKWAAVLLPLAMVLLQCLTGVPRNDISHEYTCCSVDHRCSTLASLSWSTIEFTFCACRLRMPAVFLQVRQYPDFQRGEGETWRHFGHRMCIEGHT
jgi:hypothetical protein